MQMLNKLDMLVITLRSLTGSLRRDEEGASMVEYGLLVALIAVVVAVGATALGLEIRDLFNSIVLPG
jgi:pilus assembly protein Flp/PilA